MRAEYKGATFQKTRVEYKQTYKLSERRHWYRRLTPLAWFCIALIAAGVIGFTSLAVNAVIQSTHPFVRLDEVVAEQAADVAPVAQPAKPMPTVMPARPTAAPTARPTLAPTVAPTALPTLAPAIVNGASWAAEMKMMPDGTLRAPAAIIEKASADVREWWLLNQTLDATLLVKDPQKLLGQYFAGAALQEQLAQFNTGRFTLNRGGQFSIEVKDFSVDGLTAKAGVVLRGRVDAVINAGNGRAIKNNIAGKDTLTLLTIRYDTAEHRWKITQVDDVIELKEGG
jgi:hypothetical protein